MRLISHRGNINGPNPEMENNPEYILKTLSFGYDCEIDIRYIDNNFYLGHDSPNYNIDFDFLLKNANKLWIHCKNFEAFDFLIQFPELNIFWHQSDEYTLTSHKYIWCYPKMKNSERCIILMPEWNNFLFEKGYGICSDYIDKIEKML
uniref:Phosphatidylinositol-specific phospholipase C X domain-containing protein n=1 Tax=viral metagenome TaxID=1070528 RepID=A0A6C0KWA8_9ZZZZ